MNQSNNIIRHKRYFWMGLALCLAGYSFSSALWAKAPVSYTATYQIIWNHFTVGQASYTLKTTPKNYYFDVNVDLKLLFFHYKMEEWSKGTFMPHPQAIQPERYEQLREQNRNQKKFQIQFNARQKMAHSEIATSQVVQRADIPLEPKVQDKLSLILYFAEIYNPSQKHYDFSVLDGDHIKNYAMDVVGTERIKTPQGVFRTLKVKSNRHGKEFTIWLNLKNLTLPIQIRETWGRSTEGLSQLVNVSYGDE